MRQCPHCSQLIQDAAGYCRFCEREVTPTMACSEKWAEFGKNFHQLSPAKQQTAWDQLGHDDRIEVQKLLGIVPPRLPGVREAVDDLIAAKESKKSGASFGFFVVVGFFLLVVAGAYFLLPIIGAPGSKSEDGRSQTLSTSERIDQVIGQAYETVSSLVADLGWEASDTASSAGGDSDSDTQPPVPPNP